MLKPFFASFLLGVIFLFTVNDRLRAQNLSVVSVTPARHSLSAPVNSTITIEFDRPLSRATVVPESFWAFGRWSGTVSGTYTFSNDDQMVALVPDRPFSAGETVMVILSHDLQATDGSFLRQAGYSYQFWTRAAAAAMEFHRTDVLSTRTTTQTRTYGGFASDLNRDGWLDLSMVHEDSADVRVFLNTADGSGSFEPFLEPTTPVGAGASPNEPADFNHDGHVDACVANSAHDTVSILLGNGDGTFQPQQVVDVGGTPRGVAVLDADGDGDIDIVSTSDTESHLAYLENDGAGVFADPVFFEAGGTRREWALAASDMNDDGILDLVVGNRSGGGTSGEIVINLGNGDGTFTALPDVHLTIGRVWMLVCGDLNGDTHEDVALCNINNSNAAVGGAAILLGNGDGTLQTAVDYPISRFDPTSTDLGDLDGDGDLDWMVGASTAPGRWSIFTNDGNGVFTLFEEIPAARSASCTLMLDFDNDGDLDLGLVDEFSDTVTLMESREPLDCNTNEISDRTDIRDGTSQDCNLNEIPDECDIESDVSADLNENGVPDECELNFLRGECNDDGEVDVSDAVCILDWRFGNLPEPSCVAATDTNGDADVDISDAIWLLNFLFLEDTPPPTEPFPDCGPSSLVADDELGCVASMDCP